jgi:hypothetical protein
MEPKKDWLDRAREPSDGPRVAVWVISIAIVVVAAVTLLALGLF